MRCRDIRGTRSLPSKVRPNLRSLWWRPVPSHPPFLCCFLFNKTYIYRSFTMVRMEVTSRCFSVVLPPPQFYFGKKIDGHGFCSHEPYHIERILLDRWKHDHFEETHSRDESDWEELRASGGDGWNGRNSITHSMTNIYIYLWFGGITAVIFD